MMMGQGHSAEQPQCPQLPLPDQPLGSTRIACALVSVARLPSPISVRLPMHIISPGPCKVPE